MLHSFLQVSVLLFLLQFIPLFLFYFFSITIIPLFLLFSSIPPLLCFLFSEFSLKRIVQ